MKTKIILILSLFIMSCSVDKAYDGPIYLVEVTHNAKDFGQIDTFIMGQPEIKFYNNNNTTQTPYILAENSNGDRWDIDNVYKFKIIARLHSAINDTTMYYDKIKKRPTSEKSKNCNKWYKF